MGISNFSFCISQLFLPAARVGTGRAVVQSCGLGVQLPAHSWGIWGESHMRQSTLCFAAQRVGTCTVLSPALRGAQQSDPNPPLDTLTLLHSIPASSHNSQASSRRLKIRLQC